MSPPFNDDFFNFVDYNANCGRKVFCLVFPGIEEQSTPWVFGEMQSFIATLSSIVEGYWTGFPPPLRQVIRPPGGFRYVMFWICYNCILLVIIVINIKYVWVVTPPSF